MGGPDWTAFLISRVVKFEEQLARCRSGDRSGSAFVLYQGSSAMAADGTRKIRR
jgi:hypothetical protein